MPRRVNAKKRHWRVEGVVPGIGEIREYFWASTPKQAIWLIARRLEKRAENPSFRARLDNCGLVDITDDKRWTP